MDSFEAAKIVHDRIMRLEPEHIARKIVGYIYLHDLPDQEMIRLALGPDQLIQNLIHKAKSALMLSPAPAYSPPISPGINPSPISDASFQLAPPFSPASPRPISSPVGFRVSAPYWERQLATDQQSVHNSDIPYIFSDSVHDEYRLQNQFMSLEEQLDPVNFRNPDFPGDFYYPEAAYCNASTEGSRIPINQLEFPVKTCHYFNKGFCKHGSNCRYFHGQLFSESYSRVFGPNSNENAGEDQLFSPGSLEKLELEITELLKSRRGNPVSIASLPMIYYEKYGKTLQAEGYLTESQRHGKAGYSLTKLLARLKSSIRLIDRPHGQHSVILAEDAPKFLETRGERNDPGPIVSGSRQIYLTFPAESTFTEENVCNYFSTFGPVQDVRIPCQQKRMFGFVTFGSADTVKIILSKGNPHYVCGARVLVKPYREKSKLVERKYQEKFEPQICYNLDHIDSEFQPRWPSSRILRKQLIQDHEQALEFENRRLSQLQLTRKHLSNQSCFGYSMDELKVSEDCSKFPSAERFNYLLEVLNSGSTRSQIAVGTAQNFGIVGNGRLHILQLSPTPNAAQPVTEIASFDTADGVYDCCWSESHDSIVIAGLADASVKLYDLSLPPTANPIRSLHEHTREVHSVDYNGVRKDSFLSSSWDDTIKLWTVDRPDSIKTFKEHAYCVYSAAWNPRHADVFASASGDCTARIWDVREPGSTMILPAHEFEILSCDWNKYDDSIIATASVDKSIKVWDVRSFRVSVAVLNGHGYAVRRVKFSPHRGSVIASCSYDMTVCLWDYMVDDAIIGRYDHHTEFAVGVVDMSVLVEGLLASTGWDELVYVWQHGMDPRAP